MKKLLGIGIVVLCIVTSALQKVDAYYPCNLINASWAGNCEGCGNLDANTCHQECVQGMYGYDCSRRIQKAPLCSSPVTGISFSQVTYPCACSNGNIVTNKSEYASCYQLLTCWDGSLAPDQNFCPRQNVPSFCAADDLYTFGVSPFIAQCTCPINTIMTDMGSLPGNHKFICKTQTHTCWNGTVIPINQSCPSYHPSCPYGHSWNGSQCTTNNYNYYQPQPYYHNYQLYQPYHYYQSYQDYYPYHTTDSTWNWNNTWDWEYQDNNYYYW